MRVAALLWALGLSVLSAEALPAASSSQPSAPSSSEPSSSKSTDVSKSLLSSIPKSSVSAAKRAKVICDSPMTDVGGEGTGKSGVEIWKEADMDSFLAILDHIPYSEGASLPETLADLGHASGRPACTIYNCEPFKWEKPESCTSHNGENALWSEVYRGVSNIQRFMEGFGKNIDTAGTRMASRANKYIQLLAPLKLAKAPNAAFSIIIGAVLGAIATFFFKSPQAVIGVASVAGAFGVITGGITAAAVSNEQKLLDRMEDQNNVTAAITELTTAGVDKLNEMAKKIIEDPPSNTKDEPYSSHKWSAASMLKGGNFADAPASDITDKIGDRMERTILSGIIASQMSEILIAKATKPLFGKAPCDFDYPSEFVRHCIGSTAYFFARVTKTSWPDEEWDDLSELDGWKSLTDEDNKDLYMGYTLTDLINESSNSQHRWGWSKEWDFKDDDSMDMIIDQSKSDETVSLINYPILELDPADQDPPPYKSKLGSDAVSPSVGHWKGENDRFRFMIWQAAHETKSKGRDFPWELVDRSWKHWCYEYDGKKWDPMNNWDPRK